MRARISQPSDQSFASFETARALIEGPPLAHDVDVFWNQGYFDAYYQMPIRSAAADIALEIGLAPGLKNRLHLILRYLPPHGEMRAYELHHCSGRVHLDPSWYQAAASFARAGISHILDGTDHLLFLLCLLVPFRARESLRLVGVVTAFTIAHSITLLAAATGQVPQGAWFEPLVAYDTASGEVVARCTQVEETGGIKYSAACPVDPAGLPRNRPVTIYFDVTRNRVIETYEVEVMLAGD